LVRGARRRPDLARLAYATLFRSRRIDHPRLVGEARAVGGGVVIVPARGGVLGDVDPGRAPVVAHLHLLAGAERAVAARYRQRGVAGGEVAGRAGVVGNRGDVHRRRRCRRVDGDGLAVGVADIGRRIDHPHLVGEVRAVVGGAGIVPLPLHVALPIYPGRAPVVAHLHLLAGAERAVAARHRQRGVAGGEV